MARARREAGGGVNASDFPMIMAEAIRQMGIRARTAEDRLRALEALCNDLDNLGDPDRLALKTSDVRRILNGDVE